MANVKTIEIILNENPEKLEMAIFGTQPHPNYHRISLSTLLQGDKTMNDMIMNNWYWYRAFC
ncbi:hypothetical protein A8F94_13275 [Bacillus sp. FJAT-27225]|nr:hypothetical protein A8F94_13275 [Bacillus sp. FJAT-27225]